MTRSRLPLVSDNHVLGLDGAGDHSAPIVVGTDAWYTWLANQHIQSFSFRNLLGSFTARREHKGQGWYWYAYRKRAGKLCKAYLGKTEELSLKRLNAAAAALISQGTNDDDPQAIPDEPDEKSVLQVPLETVDGTGRLFLTSPSPFMSPTEPGSATIRNLPAQPTPLIGREQEVASARRLLCDPNVRLLTLTGAPGIGKTRLALQVATELLLDFADGVCFVPLALIKDPDQVIPTIAHGLYVWEVDRPPLAYLKSYLQEQQLLLLLDNFEQLLPAAPLVAELLSACPDLKMLVTSREVLHLRAEHQFPVPHLALPDLKHLPDSETLPQYAAVDLFLQRAQAARPDFQLTRTNARTIAELCVRLDGLPLAIELAAARIKPLSPQALLAKLDRRLQVLTGGACDLPERQQTLRSTIQLSYDLLHAEEQQLFRRLSVFAGGCTLEAIEAVCITLDHGAAQVLDGVASLIDKSLVQQREQADSEQRLMMLETIREYGLEALASSGERECTRRAHAHYYLRLVEEVEPKPGEPEQAAWLERWEREHDNLRAAMQWSLERGEGGEMALRFGVALRSFWVIRGHWSEGRTFLERALAASEGPMIGVRAKALEVAASLAIYQGDHERGEALCQEGLAQCRARGDTRGTEFALYLLGTLAWQRGDFAVARSLLEESLALAREESDKEFIAHLLCDLAGMVTQQGEYAKAQALLGKSLAMHRELGNTRGSAYSLRALALTLFVAQGDLAMVHSLLEKSLMLSRELGEKPGMARCLSHAALVALQQGDAAAAHTLAEEGLALHRETGDRWGIAWVLSVVAKVEACQGEQAAARALYEESLAIARKIDSKLNMAVCLEGMASILAAQREQGRAARLWGAAEVLRETMGAPIWPVERAPYERSVAAARALLGERAFAAAWAEGRAMPLEQELVAQGPATMLAPIPAGQPSVPAAKSSVPSPAGLTRREHEVLRLLTMGQTNIQIAEQLVISLSTVNTHVGSIYTKLGVTSRAAATRYAIEHHLV
jgi:predicted ATPase/DNA-binding CsgD family transcriptional regulator